MKNCLVLCTLILLAACSLHSGAPPDSTVHSTSDRPPPSAPILLDEDLTCTHYVAPDGEDSEPGSKTQPWGTPQHAADTAQPGDTICFREGTYPLEEAVHLARSGTADAAITFAAAPGERPVLDGGGTAGGLITLDQGASYLRVSGFTLLNFMVWGLDLTGENYHIHLDHLTIIGGEAGVHFTYGADDLAPPEGGPVEFITLEDSLIRDSEYTAVDCTPGPCSEMVFRRLEITGAGLAGGDSFGADALAISRGYPVLVEDCIIHDNGGDGIDLNSRDHAGHASGVIVRRSRVFRNHQNGIKLWAGGRIENNLVWGQGNSALWLGTFDGTLEVVSNTIAFNMWDPVFSGRNWAFSAGYPEEDFGQPQVDLLLVNNIFAFNTSPAVGDPTGIYLGPEVTLTEHHNLYYSRSDGEITAEFLDREFTRQELSDGTWTQFTGQGEGGLVVDPLFLAGWPEVDLHLQPGSPAIGAGDRAYCPAEDLNGDPRPVDGAGSCDLGALVWNE